MAVPRFIKTIGKILVIIIVLVIFAPLALTLGINVYQSIRGVLVERRLSVAKELWAEQNPETYNIQTELIVPSGLGKMKVFLEVKNSSVESWSVYCLYEEYRPCKEGQEFDAAEFTPDGLFSILDDWIDRDRKSVSAKFNKQFGYPEIIKSNDWNAIHDETTYKVLKFEIL